MLALETAGTRLGVCLWEDFRIRASKTDARQEASSDHLMPLMDELFHKAKWTPAELDAIAVDVGPGRFTGLRLGVSAARALGQALQKPIVEVTSLEAMAAQGSGWELNKPFVWKFTPELLCVLADAMRGEVYMAAWRFHRPNERLRGNLASGKSLHTFGHHFKLVHSPSLFPFDRFLTFFQSCFQQQTICFAGNAVPLHRKKLQQAFGSRARFAAPEAHLDPCWTAALGSEKFFRREIKSFPQVQPLYMRPSYAEENAAKVAASLSA